MDDRRGSTRALLLAASADADRLMARKDGWSALLTCLVEVKEGPTLTTLADAWTYVLSLPASRQTRKAWQHASALMVEAAKSGETEAVTTQLELALIMDGRLVLRESAQN